MGAIDDPVAALALKYMLLCKIMMNAPEDVQALVNGKLALRFAGSDIDAILAVAKASSNRSLGDFETVLKQYPTGTQLL